MRSLAIVIALVACASPALAHQTSVKYVELSASDQTVAVSIRFAPGDVAEAMGLPADASPPLARVLAHGGVPAYVQAWLVVVGCATSAPAIRPSDERFLEVAWDATCATPRQITIDATGLFALDPRQEALVRFAAPHAEPIQTVVRASAPRVALRAGHPASPLAWIHTGLDHIYGGGDHVLFVLALLLVVMLQRDPAEAWTLRRFVPTLRSTALVVTAFTVAHSLTLIGASLGVVALPSAPVEIAIALSIAYTAVEDIALPAVRWRFWLTFGFGLVHGLGFAGVLGVLLPPDDVVGPLLWFNLGVELGQLSIVTVALPGLYLVARTLGPRRYRRFALPALAAPIALLGVVMVVERVAGISLVPM